MQKFTISVNAKGGPVKQPRLYLHVHLHIDLHEHLDLQVHLYLHVHLHIHVLWEVITVKLGCGIDISKVARFVMLRSTTAV